MRHQLLAIIPCCFLAMGSSEALASSGDCFVGAAPCYEIKGRAGGLNAVTEGFFDIENGATSASDSLEINGPLAGRSFASIDVSLDDGTIRPMINSPGRSFSSEGSWIDTIWFDLPENVASVTIPVTITIDGVNTDINGAAGNTFNNIVASFSMLGYFSPGAGGNGFSVGRSCQATRNWSFNDLCQEGEVSWSYSDSITVTEDQYYFVNFSLNIGGTGWDSDFSNTASFSWDLPQGVQYTSQSGRFLRGFSNAVPEPEAWLMMILGFLGIGAILRRSRRNSPTTMAANSS